MKGRAFGASSICPYWTGEDCHDNLSTVYFKNIAAHNKMHYLGAKSIRPYLSALNAGTDTQPFEASEPTFISCEALAGWDPENWRVFADKNQAHFGADATILLLIRAPDRYLNSVYLQSCVHMGNPIPPELFFRSGANYPADPNTTQFNVSAYNYQGLIDIYFERFNKVIVQKYEHLNDLRFLKENFEITNQMEKQVSEDLSRRSSNRSFSQTAVDISSKLSRAKIGGTRLSCEEQANKPFKRKLYHRIWRKFIQYGFDKIVPYQPFFLDWNTLPMIDIAALSNAYEALPPYQVGGTGKEAPGVGQ